MSTPEGRVKTALNRTLEKVFGERHWRFMPVQSGFGKKALDYILCINGRFASVETKKPGGKLTPLQESTKEEIETAGGVVLVVSDQKSLDHAIEVLLALETTTHVGHDLRTYLTPTLHKENEGVLQEHLRSVQLAKAALKAARGDY